MLLRCSRRMGLLHVVSYGFSVFDRNEALGYSSVVGEMQTKRRFDTTRYMDSWERFTWDRFT